jgi:signal transduction histidine kinase
LKQLIDKTRRIGAGDLTKPIRLRSRDELGELAESLNRMCDQLAESRASVERETAGRIAAMEQLRHADRLKTVGRLASGMAHELGTPLNVVSGRAGLIASGRLSTEEAVESASAIKQEADKMTAIIRQLLDFARRSAPHRASVDLRQVVRQTANLLTGIAERRGVAISVADLSQPAPVNVDVGQIQQVLSNLVVNATHAMPDGGNVRLSIHRQRARPPREHEGSEGDYCRVDVRDEGVGINEEDVPHVFEPFFTTKELGEGTGLGLSIAYGIVREHGGWIDVTSRPGEGSCFSVYLPEESSQ